MNNPATTITVETTVNTPIETVWKLWTTPADIMQWNTPSADWHCPSAEADLKEGGTFSFRMEAKDGSVGFDHSGKYSKIVPHELIEYIVSDGRSSVIKFIADGNKTTIAETFVPEKETPLEMQKGFTQSVINNFKKYAESK
jgi:uncharacterized protein YndB with AHSA1/START domain